MHHPLSMLLRLAMLCCGLTLLGLAHAAAPFGFDDVAARAAERARAPYKTPPTRSAALDGLDYDAYRDIRFRPSRALWREPALPFELMFLAPGFTFKHTVRLNEVVDGTARPLQVPFDSFEFGPRVTSTPQGGADLAGFRVHYPLNNADYKDELIVFLGASYFRAVGAGQLYGLSARGIAVDTVGGDPAKGEEFPAFQEFWIERPARDAKELVVHALLDGPRVTGAYRFVVRPGTDTVIDVRARLYLRAPVATLGIAPLTSMYMTGENQPRGGDFRPEVHDSDGLQLLTSAGEWIWRPLSNPNGIFVTSFSLPGVRGFGLMQRDRAFPSYEDTEARYERRPSVWITPKGDWGAGRVELMQFRTKDEFTDNVVAYWVPAAQPAPGRPLDLAYEMRWQGDAATRPPGAWTQQSRRGSGWEAARGDELQFQIDFAGPALRGLPPDAKLDVIATSGSDNARVSFAHAFRHPVVQDGWRTTLKVQRRSPAQPVELRVFLRHNEQVLTETWSYAVPPE
jgi:glucans biosynthesis protein